VAEYGVHWNFFLTLAALSVLGVFAELIWPEMPYLAMAAVVTVGASAPLDAKLTVQRISAR